MQIVIHGINHQEKTSKEGNTYLRCGIKYRGKWYSGFGDDITQTWEVGNLVDVDLWEEEGKPDQNGDVKVFGNFVRIKSPYEPKAAKPVTSKPAVTGPIDPADLPDINPENDLPF